MVKDIALIMYLVFSSIKQGQKALFINFLYKNMDFRLNKLSKLSLGFKQFLVKTGVFGGVGGEERKKN
mgnify:FL=1